VSRGNASEETKSSRSYKMKVINLTPHTIKVVNSDNQVIREYPSAGIARVATTAEVIDEVDGISVVRTKFGAVKGLPEPDGSVFIVSMVVAQAVSGRKDVVAPDTGPSAYRDKEGKIVGVRQFARY
jgi:hypothetical protein